jgi:hypothetical protein
MGLPEFLIIGAPKAGTTWLVSCLRRHPGVFIPQQEIHYWTRNADKIDASHGWYREHFAAASPGQRIGENSNTYLTQSEVAPLIARDLPAARLIVMLRNPVDRAYSGYCMALRYGDVTPDISLYLDPGRTPYPQILRNSLYHARLQPYCAAFPRERIHFIVFDDIASKPTEVVAGLCRFLEIGPPPSGMGLAGKVNEKDKKWPSPLVHRLWKRSAALRSASQRLQGTRMHELLRRVLTYSVDYPALPESVRHRLAGYFRTDVQQLSALLGRDLTHWTEPAARG